MLELQCEHYENAKELSRQLASISGRLREGSEAAFAGALSALSLYAVGEEGSARLLQSAIDSLRVLDAKHRLAYVLTRTAELDLRFGRFALARAHAQEALETGQILEHPSEVALALTLLVKSADALGDEAAKRRHMDELRRLSLESASTHAQKLVRRLIKMLGNHVSLIGMATSFFCCSGLGGWQ